MATIIVNPFYVSGGGGGGSSTLLTNLVSWWDLTANGNDSHGSNNLSNRGSPSFGTVGGYASVTTSTTAHLYNAAPSGTGLDTMSLAVWVYVTTANSAMQVLKCGDTHLPAGSRYEIRVGADDPTMKVSDGSSHPDVASANTAPLTTWTLIIGTYDSSTGELNVYVDDGTNTASGSSGFTTLNAGQTSIGIGGDGDGSGSGNEFVGAIKSAAIWSRILTSDERTELWNSGVPLVYADL